MGVRVAEGVGELVGLLVEVWVGVWVAVLVAVLVGVLVAVSVEVFVKVLVGVKVGVAVGVFGGLFVDVWVIVEVAVEVAVQFGVKVKVGLGVGVDCCKIWMASTFGWSAPPGVNWITICPLAFGVRLLNTSSRALYWPPAVANRSKLVISGLPLMLRLNSLLPAAVQKFSENFRVAW